MQRTSLRGEEVKMQRCEMETSCPGSGTGGKALCPAVSHELRMSQRYNAAGKTFAPIMTSLSHELNKCNSGEYKDNYSVLLSTNSGCVPSLEYYNKKI